MLVKMQEHFHSPTKNPSLEPSYRCEILSISKGEDCRGTGNDERRNGQSNKSFSLGNTFCCQWGIIDDLEDHNHRQAKSIDMEYAPKQAEHLPLKLGRWQVRKKGGLNIPIVGG